MRRRRTTLVGRRDELAALDAVATVVGRAGGLTVLRGPTGIGKSSLLAAAVRRWRRAGIRVIDVREVPDTDPFAGAGIVEAVRASFERLDDPRLTAPIEALTRLAATVESTPVSVLAMVMELNAAFDLIGAAAPTVLVVDDAERIAHPALLLNAAARPGCRVVATVGRPGPPAAALLARAERVIDLAGLTGEQTDELLTQHCGGPVDEQLVAALRAALGPLAGNPGTLLATLDELTRSGRVEVRGGRSRLSDPAGPIPLPADHPGDQLVVGLGPEAVRLVTAAATARLAVADLPLLAEAVRGRVTDCGRQLDRLVADGVLAVTTAGTIRVRCPALADRLVGDAGPTAVARLHRTYAAAMLARVGRGQCADQAVLADHVTSAGSALPSDGWTADRLVAAADRALDDQPMRASEWLLAALRHADGSWASREILPRLLRVLVRTGRYRRLAEVVDAAAAWQPTADPGLGVDLASAAALAAVHLGRPIPAATSAVLAGAGPAARRRLACCARWFGLPVPEQASTGTEVSPVAPPDGGPPLLTDDELDQVTGLLTGRDVARDAPEEGLAEAASAGDLSTLLELVMGPRYGVPTEGPLAAYRLLRRRYAQGDLAGALSAARELEAADDPDSGKTPIPRLTRLITAEIHLLRGDAGAAAGCIDAVPDEPPYALARWLAGAEAARWGEGDAVALWRTGWSAYRRQRHQGGGFGRERALPVLAELAVRGGDPARMAQISAAVGPGSGLSRRTAGLVRAVLAGDAEAGRVGAAADRASGDRTALLDTCLRLSRLPNADGRWLTEAYELARAFDSPHLRSRVAALMRSRGISPPRARPIRTGFSGTEQKIIELVRDGRTNRQIAAALRVSEKTVENHLTRLFAATGCRSRVELVAASLTGQAAAGTGPTAPEAMTPETMMPKAMEAA